MKHPRVSMASSDSDSDRFVRFSIGELMTARLERIRLPVYDGGSFRMISVSDSGPSHARQVYLCLPGLLETSRSFDEFAAQVTREHRVVTLDYAGRGDSDKLGSFAHYKMSTCMTDVCAAIVYIMGVDLIEPQPTLSKILRRDQKGSRLHLIGNCMGGLLAVAFASNYPQIPISITLNDVGCLLPWSGLMSMMGAIGRSTSFSADNYLSFGSSALAEELDIDSRLLGSVLRPAFADLSFEQTMLGLGAQRYFSELETPLLLVHSKDSPLVTSHVLDLMEKMEPHPYFYAVPGDHHPAQYSKAVINEILRFTEHVINYAC